MGTDQLQSHLFTQLQKKTIEIPIMGETLWDSEALHNKFFTEKRKRGHVNSLYQLIVHM